MGSPRVVRRPARLSRSWARVHEWLELPQAWIPLPTDRHLDVIDGLLAGESRAGLVNDAHLAALAIEHGLIVCSSDRDFARFRGVRWEDPLQGG